MKKYISSFLWIALSLVYHPSAKAQQEKLAALIFTTSSNEALITFNQALRLNDFGEEKQARALFEKAVKQDPRFTAANLYLAWMASSPQEFAQLLEKSKDQLDKSSNWEKLFYDYTETFMTGNMPKRMEAAQKMISIYPHDARSLTLLAQAFAAKNDVTAARMYFQQAIDFDPASPLGYRGLVDSYLFQEPKDFKKAEQNASKLVSLQPLSSSYILLGDTYRAQNNLQKAKNAYGKAVDADAENPIALYKRGHAYTFLGEFDKARTDYGKAQTLDITPTNGIINTALTYLYDGQPANGLRYLVMESGKLDTKNAAQAMQTQLELLGTASQIAFHIKDNNSLQQIIPLMEPLINEIAGSLPVKEGQLRLKSELMYWQACAKMLNNDLEGAASLLDGMKTLLEPVQDPRKLEEYEFLQGMISYNKKDFPGAISHFNEGNRQSVYTKYWIAKAYEGDGMNDNAKKLYKDITGYNFNEVGYALVRNEARQK